MKLKNLAMMAITAMLTGCGNESDIIKDGTMKHYPQAHIGDVLESNFDNTDWSIEEKNGTTYVTFSGEITEELHNKAVKKLNYLNETQIKSIHFSEIPSKHPLSIEYCQKLKVERASAKKKIIDTYPWLEGESDIVHFDRLATKYLRNEYQQQIQQLKEKINEANTHFDSAKIHIISSGGSRFTRMKVYNKYKPAPDTDNEKKFKEYQLIINEIEKLEDELKELLRQNRYSKQLPKVFKIVHFGEEGIGKDYTNSMSGKICYDVRKMMLTSKKYQDEIGKYELTKPIAEKFKPLKKKLLDFMKDEDERLKEFLANLNRITTEADTYAKNLYDAYNKKFDKHWDGYNKLRKHGYSMEKVINGLVKPKKDMLKKEYYTSYLNSFYWAPEECCTITWTLFTDGKNFEIKSMNADSWGHNKFTVNDVFDVIYSN